MGSYSDLNYCLWESEWLSEFSNHQATAYFMVLEIEKEFLESAFYFLKHNHIKDLFLQPDEKEIRVYVLEKKSPVILKPLITRSPLQKIGVGKLKIKIPRLEKILADLFCDRDIFYFYGGGELESIFQTALDRYPVDFSRLLNYAKRRGKGAEIEQFISQKLNYSLDGILR